MRDQLVELPLPIGLYVFEQARGMLVRALDVAIAAPPEVLREPPVVDVLEVDGRPIHEPLRTRQEGLEGAVPGLMGVEVGDVERAVPEPHGPMPGVGQQYVWELVR